VVPALGPGMTLVLLVLTPILWSAPVALAMAELASAMPDEGGYVAWTRQAFGPYWAFQVGWWSWIDSFVDVAVYPALFVEYLRFWMPAMTALERWLLVVVFIVALTGLNLLGVRPTGHAAVGLAIASLLPVGVLTVVALLGPRVSPWTPLTPTEQGLATLGLGLAVVMWNYSGFDTPSTILGETRSPERAFRSAMFGALIVLTAAYVLPVGAALARVAPVDDRRPAVDRAVGGRRVAGPRGGRGRRAQHGRSLHVAAPHQLAPAVRHGARSRDAPLARRGRSAIRHAVDGGRRVRGALRRLRGVLLQGADRPERLALLAEPAGRARGLRAAARGCARSATAVASPRGSRRRRRRGRVPRAFLRRRDGDGRLRQHDRRRGGRADRAAGVPRARPPYDAHGGARMNGLVACVAYAGGRRLGEVSIPDISEVLKQPDRFVWVGLVEPDDGLLGG